MKTLFLIALLSLSSLVCRGASVPFTAFRGAGTITVTTNPTLGTVTITGSGSATNAQPPSPVLTNIAANPYYYSGTNCVTETDTNIIVISGAGVGAANGTYRQNGANGWTNVLGTYKIGYDEDSFLTHVLSNATVGLYESVDDALPYATWGTAPGGAGPAPAGAYGFVTNCYGTVTPANLGTWAVTNVVFGPGTTGAVVSGTLTVTNNAGGRWTNILFAVSGDSLSTTNGLGDVGAGAGKWTNTWPGSLYTYYPRWIPLPNTNWSVNGRTLFQMNSAYATELRAVRPNVTNQYSGAVVIIWAGYNDIAQGSNAVRTFAMLSNMCWRARIDNYLVGVGTIHQTGMTGTNEVQRTNFNNLIRAPTNRFMFDYLVDVEKWTTNTAAGTMLAPYNIGDGIHFNAAGNRFIAANIESNVTAQSVAPLGMRSGTVDGYLRVQSPSEAAGIVAFDILAPSGTIGLQQGYNFVNVSGGNKLLLQTDGGMVGIGFGAGFASFATSELTVRGAIAANSAVVTLTAGNYTMDGSGVQDYYVGIPNGSLRTNTLFNAADFPGREVTTYDAGNTAAGVGSNVWVRTVSSQTINGGPVLTNIGANNGSITLFSDGTGFRIKSSFP